MSLLIAQGLGFAHGSEPIFEELDFTIEPRDRLGVVGRNGCGKSSLLKLILGELEPDSGSLTRQKGMIVQGVAQFAPAQITKLPVFDAVAQNARHRGAVHEIERILDQLSFSREDWDKPVGVLSGGWVNRLLLARALAAEPDLLLLDEPTNHMDLSSILFFEEFLSEHVRCATVLVSHDRSVLDACTTRTLFLRDRRAYMFSGHYSRARSLLLERDEAAMIARRSEEQDLARLRKSASRLIQWARNAKSEKLRTRARSIERRIERLEGEKTFVSTDNGRGIAVDTQDARAPVAIRCEKLVVPHPAGGAPLFSVDGLFVRRGDRVAVLGKNGTGKTVFLKLLVAAFESQRAGAAPADGLRLNPQLELGYYDQSLGRIPPDATLSAIVRDAMNLPAAGASSALVRAGFRVLDHGRQARDLSGGERARLQLLLLSLQKPSLLVLDEPTNHIDIDGCENLESEIIDREVTTLFVSHDRRFVANVATRFFVVEDGRMREAPSPEAYYDSEREDTGRSGAEVTGAALDARDDAAGTGSSDELLRRIGELEGKLQAERRQRKDRQNSTRQAKWEAEIAELYRELESALG